MNIRKEEERKYSFKVLERQIEVCFSTTLKEKEKQRKKYDILMELVQDLFKYKNSTVCYSTISNLIIASLMMYNEDYPLDIYDLLVEEFKTKKDNDEDYKQILRDELNQFSIEVLN
jgi:hypothetical protein